MKLHKIILGAALPLVFATAVLAQTTKNPHVDFKETPWQMACA